MNRDKPDIICRKNKILQAPHIRIFPAKTGQVFDNWKAAPFETRFVKGIFCIKARNAGAFTPALLDYFV